MTKPSTKSSQLLVKIGLSSYEAKVYELLMNEGSLTIKDLAKKIKVFPSGLYRLISKLEKKGLVSISLNYPKRCRAIPASIALDAYMKQRILDIERIRDDLVSRFVVTRECDQTKIDLINNMGHFFHSYAQLAGVSKEEIVIISIGETIPEEVVLANRDALERGIKIRFIAHKYNKDNRDILTAWKRMGLEVKHYPGWGFHLVIFDRKITLLCTNNPQNTSERLGIKISSEGLSKALSDYFYSVWEKAVVVE